MGGEDSIGSDFLFARPSAVSGVARVLDLFGVFDAYNVSHDGKEADARALYWDFRLVGEDIASATASFAASPEAEPAQHSFVFAGNQEEDRRIGT